jgi:hypothetical protein
LGWAKRSWDDARYLPLQDDIASTAFWYQTEPHAPYVQEFNLRRVEVI